MKYFAADISASDLSLIISEWKYLVLIAVVIIAIIYSINYFSHFKEKIKSK